MIVDVEWTFCGLIQFFSVGQSFFIMSLIYLDIAKKIFTIATITCSNFGRRVTLFFLANQTFDVGDKAPVFSYLNEPRNLFFK